MILHRPHSSALTAWRHKIHSNRESSPHCRRARSLRSSQGKMGAWGSVSLKFTHYNEIFLAGIGSSNRRLREVLRQFLLVIPGSVDRSGADRTLDRAGGAPG